MALLPYADATDESIVQGCADGDPDASEALRGRYGVAVRAVVLRTIAEMDPDSAGQLDAMADEVWRHLAHSQAAPLRLWSGRSRLRTFLCQVARQHAASVVSRRRLTETTVQSLDGAQGGTSPGTQDAATAETLDRLWVALDRLPPHVGAMVRLRMRGLRRSEIAAALGLPTATVHKTLEQASSRIRGALGMPDPAGRKSQRPPPK